MQPISLPTIRGRGIPWNPPNRFERLHVDRSNWLDPDDPLPQTLLLDDTTRSILSKNESPDVGFDVGLNPYRGCSHGCSYCYARPSHEYLGFSSGLDFETRIAVKRGAPNLLREALGSRRWHPRVIGLSGNTDPYQPVERRLRITRRCLEVLADFRNPVAISASGPNLGAAIFLSTPGGPNDGGPDPDLLVDLGNVLILQSEDAPGQNAVPGVFDVPNEIGRAHV